MASKISSAIRAINYKFNRIFIVAKFLKIKKVLKNSIIPIEFYSFSGNFKGDPTESFSHYDAFSFWLHNKLAASENLKILDLGGLKISNSILSINHNVVSAVLVDPNDKISNVQYLVGDVTEGIDLPKSSFDVFTSTVSLHLIGMGRYGDKFNPEGLLKFIEELDFTLKPKCDIYISVPVGSTDGLIFNSGYIFTLETWKELFGKFELKSILIDNFSVIGESNRTSIRFTDEISQIEELQRGSYKTVFLHFSRN
jgi:hypothetical protein